MAPSMWRNSDEKNQKGGFFGQKPPHQDRDDILTMQTLREIPKTRYATQVAITQLPSGRGRKAVFSHIELYKMVEAIATELRESGVRPGTVCAMAVPNSVDAIVYFLALQWIGAIAAPIDPDLSEADLKEILTRVQATTLVSPPADGALQEQDTNYQKLKSVSDALKLIHWNIFRSTNKGVELEQHGQKVGEGAAWKGGSGDFKLDPSEMCVHLGSTPSWDESSPRGIGSLVVPLSHYNVVTAAKTFAKLYDLLPASNTTIMTDPLNSVHGIVIAVGTLYTGGHILIPGNGKQLSGADLLTVAAENKVNWLSAPSKLIADFYTSALSNPSNVKKLHLSFIRSHEGCLPKETHESAESLLNTQILNTYGTPESCGMIAAGVKGRNIPGCSGPNVPGVAFVVVDPETRQVCPKGVSGDIAVCGDVVFAGYLNNKQANERCRVKVTDEFGNEQTYFLTNERGQITDDGLLHVAENSRELRAAERDEKLEADRKMAMVLEAERAAELLRLEEERVAKEKKEKEEEERRIQLENERAAQLQAERLEAEKLKEERTKNLSSELKSEYSSSEAPSSNQEDDTASLDDSGNVDLSRSKSAYQPEANMNNVMGLMKAGSVSTDPEAMSKILEKLLSIEGNQRRMEEELKQKHAVEMAEMSRLLDEAKEANRIATLSHSTAPDPMVMQVNMDEINSAVNAASLAAQDSSRHTAEAAEAAKAAALAAQEAAANRKSVTEVDPNASKVEVNDPDNVQKTVMVSLDELEEALLLHPAVAVCRAFGRPDPRYGNEVFCAILPKKGARISEPWLKLHAQSVLPAACVPKKFFYHPDLKPDTERRDLAGDKDLKRVSHLAGYSSTRMVKAPSWVPDDQKRAAA